MEFPRSITPGEKVYLREGALPFVRIREWEFEGIEKGMLLLRHKGKGYTIEVSPEDVHLKICEKGERCGT